MFGKSGKELRSKRFDSQKTDFERVLFSQEMGVDRKLPKEKKEAVHLPWLFFE